MEKIRLRLSDWLYNAGLVGFVNILKHSGEQIEYDGQDLLFDTVALDNFEDKYFKYFIDTYEYVMVFSKLLIRVNNLINYSMKNENMENLEKEINEDIKYIKDKLKNSAYKDKVLRVNLNLLLPLSKKNRELEASVLHEIKDVLLSNKINIIKAECIGFYDQKSKSSKSPNAVIDKYLNTNMLDINNLIDGVYKYTESEKVGFKFKCFSCNREINAIDKGLSFLNRMYFDTSRKTSHVWNFISDIEYCPICKLVYYCIPAGFTTVFGRGIFINENHSVENAVRINKNIQRQILKSKEMDVNTTFKAMVISLQEAHNESSKYELSDIQVVRYENVEGKENYRFNILSKKILNVISQREEELNSLLNAGFKEDKNYFRLYEEVIKRILNNENLFLLLHKVLVMKISKPSDAWLHLGHVKSLLQINVEYLKGVGSELNNSKDTIKAYSGAGYYLKQAYKAKNSENKLNGISYRLLNALKTNNKAMFMDVILNCYLYTGKQVPSFITDCLKDTEVFKTVGYAFVAGLIDGNSKNEDMNNGGIVE